jgi:Zn-dependent protease with chaperone function
MHTLLDGVSLLLIAAGSLVLRSILRRVRAWQLRRWLQVSALCLPILVVAVGLSGLQHLLGAWCPLPTWDVLFGIVGPLLVTALACGALGRSVFHFLRVRHHVALLGQPAPGDLQRQLEALAIQQNIPCPRLLVCSLPYPVALAYGVKKPVVLLSSWMVTHLDRQEITEVLAHKLEHVVRQDYLLLFLATLLRDAFFYLPMQQATYQQIHQEKELACDKQATLATRRPLALASACSK